MDLKQLDMEKYHSDFLYFWSLIDSHKNFTFARYADGEVLLMEGKRINEKTQAGMIDKWTAPEMMTKVGFDLLKTLNHVEDNYFYAISAKTDNIHDYEFLIKNIKQNPNKISFVNLWINANYEKMIEKLHNLKRPVNLICNENILNNLSLIPFKINQLQTFNNDCVTFWEKNGDSFIKELLDKFKNTHNELFFISCGPISEIIIHELYNNNPNNTYIDVGSSIDEFVHGKKTRPYMNPTSGYSKMISKF